MNLMLAVLFAVAAGASAPRAAGGHSPTGAVSSVLSRVTSQSAYYDHAEGYAYFNGAVHVDDPEYQLHADRAYVFMDGTNALKKIVALGHVAMTNGLRRASGDKVTYYKKSGLVILATDKEGKFPAEVREKAQDGDRVIRGKKIKFWTTSRQVEVEEAWLEAQRSAAAGDRTFKEVIGR